MKRRILYFTAPRQVELREESLPALGADDILVETTCSAISAGTEMLIFQGRFPRDLETDSIIPSLRGAFSFPVAYGYACVGIVREIGTQVASSWKNKSVFSFQPHTSHFICKTDALFPVPPSLSAEAACFLPNVETAVNLVQDAAPILGERVLVLGQGVVGLLTASLLKEFPLATLATVDHYALRRKASLEIGVADSIEPESIRSPNENKQNTVKGGQSLSGSKTQYAYAQSNFDLTIEVSGAPAALNGAIYLTRFGGRVVIGSWYGDKRAEIDLGSSFHRSRIKLISSQVSTISPELSARWDKARRFEVAWNALGRIKPEKWITHRFQIDEADKAYELLDKKPQETIQVIFEYHK